MTEFVVRFTDGNDRLADRGRSQRVTTGWVFDSLDALAERFIWIASVPPKHVIPQRRRPRRLADRAEPAPPTAARVMGIWSRR
jgi:hypothetical protein